MTVISSLPESRFLGHMLDLLIVFLMRFEG